MDKTITLRRECNIDDLIVLGLNWCDKSRVPFELFNKVKTEGLVDELFESLFDMYSVESEEPLLDDFMSDIIDNLGNILTKLDKNKRPLTARELFNMDDKVYLKDANGEICLIFSLSVYNDLEICFQPDSGHEYYDWYSVEDLIKKGFTFKDGSSLFVGKDDSLFKEK